MSKIYDELKSAEQTHHAGSHVAAGLVIKGEISGNEDLVTDGTIEGPVTLANAVLTVGEKGAIKGTVVAKELVVHGALTGNVEASDRVEIKPKGSIVGDIATSRIVIDDGAHCKGSIDISRK